MAKSFALFLLLSAHALAAAANPCCVLSMNVPKYPPLARAARIQGTVVVKVLIDQKGVVTDASIISGHAMLKDTAITNVRTWRFEPPSDGKPLEALVTYKYILDAEPEASCSRFRFENPGTIEVYGDTPIINTSNSEIK